MDIDDNDPSEQWKPVVGFEGFYTVSTLGRVRSVERICGDRIMARKKPIGGAAFDQLARKLIAVPKSEADAAAKALKKQRKRRRKK